MSFGRLIERVIEKCDRPSSMDEFEERVRATVIDRLLAEARRTSWEALRSTVDVDMEADSDVGLLPAPLIGVDRVYDSTNDQEFIMQDQAYALGNVNGLYLAYTTQSSTHLVDADDAVIQAGAASFTSADVDTAVAGGDSVNGEYARIGSDPWFYLIGSASSPYTITPNFSGDDLAEGVVVIRPRGTKSLVLLDPNGDALTDRTVTVYYWRMPDPVYRDDDILPVPDDLLYLLTLRELAEAKNNRPVSQAEIDSARGDALRQNPSLPRRSSPRDRHNRMFQFNSRTLYKRRGA